MADYLEPDWDYEGEIPIYDRPRQVPERDKGWHTVKAGDSDGRSFNSRAEVREWLEGPDSARMGPLVDADCVFIIKRTDVVTEQLSEYAQNKAAIWVDREGQQVFPSNFQIRRHPRPGEKSIRELGWKKKKGPAEEKRTRTRYQIGIYNASPGRKGKK